MNIFAEQLVKVLGDHNHELSNLFSWRLVISPGTVIRLKASLISEKSATLNAEQIEFIGEKYGFTEDDNRRLRAALVAEAVRKLVADRLAINLANQLGNLTLQLLLSDNPEEVMQIGETLLNQIRGDPGIAGIVPIQRGLGDAAADSEEPLLVAARNMDIDPGLEAVALLALDNAEEALHQGLLWLEVAREAGDRHSRLGYIGQARALLARGRELAIQCAQVAQGSAWQHSLLADITTATDTVEEVL